MKSFGFQWHITDRCNLRCAHCYQDSFAPLPAENLKNLKTLADRIFKSLSPGRVFLYTIPVGGSRFGGEHIKGEMVEIILCYIFQFLKKSLRGFTGESIYKIYSAMLEG